MAAPRRGISKLEFKIASAASYFRTLDLNAYLRSKMTNRNMVSIDQQSFPPRDRSSTRRKTMVQKETSRTYIDDPIFGEYLIEIPKKLNGLRLSLPTE